MSTRVFLRCALALFVLGACWGAYTLSHPWNNQRIAGYEARQNALTGMVQIRVGDDWRDPFPVDPLAPAIPPADLQRVRFLDVAWGENGLLCGRALVTPGPPLQGRVAFQIDIDDTVWKKHIHQRELRETIDWPGGALTPFVLRTNLSTPSERNQKTRLTLQPTASGGE